VPVFGVKVGRGAGKIFDTVKMGAVAVAMVKVKILPKRAIAGYGVAGDVVSMPEALAKQYEREGYVTILK